MALTLYYHPLSSFCHKVLIALYENATPFTPQSVDLGDEGERAAFYKMWPVGKFPVLRDDARDTFVPESTPIIEYLQMYYPGPSRLIPDDAEQVNPNGGAIALGHPLGASGARLALTTMRALEERQGRYALVTLCVGVGQGVALALERV